MLNSWNIRALPGPNRLWISSRLSNEMFSLNNVITIHDCYSWMIIVFTIFIIIHFDLPIGPISENTKSSRPSDVCVECHQLFYDQQHLFQLQLDSLDLGICAKLPALLSPMDGCKINIDIKVSKGIHLITSGVIKSIKALSNKCFFS